jgi:hypothetical protein
MRKISSSQISGRSSSVDSILTVDANLNAIFRYVAPTYVLDDISYQFDGGKTVFGLTLDTANISTVINTTIVDSKDIDVAVNGSVLMPYVQQLTWPWITPYDSFRGYRVVGDNVYFYTAPSPGFQCSIILRNTSKSAQQRRYPFTPGSIALGD